MRTDHAHDALPGPATLPALLRLLGMRAPTAMDFC
jgi:hypothetical protein